LKTSPPNAAHGPWASTHLAAVVRVATIVGLGVIPIMALVTMFSINWTGGPLAGDFHYELYPEAKLLLHGQNPFPPVDWDPTAASNLIWPPVAAYLVAPLTIFSPGVADILIVLVGLACFAAALWLVGVRDWRIFGVVALWPEVVSEMRVSHLTPVVALLVAAAWRYRDVRGASGLCVGFAVAVKFFVWPMALWLAVIRRTREAALAALIAGVSLLLVLPYISLSEYSRLLGRLGRAFDQDSYTIYGLLVQAGASTTVAHAATIVTGAILLAGVWRYQSFALAIAAALVLSPIVWLDYFALAAIPLALARPRLSAIWFLPIATWGLSGAGLGIGDVSDIARLLVVFGLVFWIAFSHDLAAWRATAPATRPRGASRAHASIGRSSET
jgi:hypothetical protein